ncbi:MAG: STAS domain-containing protein [Myxococcales bacterium]|nr:STAS domain-containing protein [Myxococcales bacterium]
MALFDPSDRAALVDTATAALVRRRASAFIVVGEALCRDLVEAAVAALERDIEAGEREAVRPAAMALIAALFPQGLNFSDLRFFVGKLRELALAAVSEDHRGAVEAWSFEHLALCTTHFMVKRDEDMQLRAAKRDVERFETQLADLRVAFEEKTQLLEVIRQASVPIAPVVRGILVVPLVGTFDSFRAQLLIEKLLDEIARSKARVAILDISGVPVFDTESAQMLIRLARTVRMLGARTYLVGLSPDIARTIVALDVDLSDLTTLGNLQDGLARALAAQRMRIVDWPGPT